MRTIGRGHFGQVKVVKEKSSDEVFALKILKKSEMKSQQTVAFFEEERDILAAGWLREKELCVRGVVSLLTGI